MSTGLAGFRASVVARLQYGGRYRAWVLASALAGMFATTFPVTILAVSLGDIARDFGVRETLLTWVISAPLLASAVALPILGKMGDLHGHRRVFLLGFGLSTVTAVLTAGAWSAVALIGLRTLSQVIGAATQPSSMALIMSVYPPRERVKAIGYWSLVAAGAPAVGLVAGGPLVELVGWRLIFLIQAVLAFVALAAAVFVLPETARRQRVRFDVAGSATLALGVGGLMVFFTQATEWGWLHPVVLGAGAVAPLGMLAFVRAESRAADPLLPLEFLRRRNFTAPLLSSLFAGAAYMGGFILTPLLFRFVFGFSLSATALLMVLRPMTYSLSSPVGGHVSTRIGERATGVTGTAGLSVALGLFAYAAWIRSPLWAGVALVLQGFGNGIARPPLTATVANEVGDHNLGIGAASQRMVFQVGSSLGIAILTVFYAGHNAPGPFFRAYLAGAVLAVIALVAATFVRSAKHDEEPGGRAVVLAETQG